jgi:hypothetical protein
MKTEVSVYSVHVLQNKFQDIEGATIDRWEYPNFRMGIPTNLTDFLCCLVGLLHFLLTLFLYIGDWDCPLYCTSAESLIYAAVPLPANFYFSDHVLGTC